MKKIGYSFLVLFLLCATPLLAAEGDCPTGASGLLCRAQQGNADAQFELGMKMVSGEVPGASHLDGLAWVEKAARQDHPLATSVFAQMTLSSEPGGTCGK